MRQQASRFNAAVLRRVCGHHKSVTTSHRLLDTRQRVSTTDKQALSWPRLLRGTTHRRLKDRPTSVWMSRQEKHSSRHSAFTLLVARWCVLLFTLLLLQVRNSRADGVHLATCIAAKTIEFAPYRQIGVYGDGLVPTVYMK